MKRGSLVLLFSGWFAFVATAQPPAGLAIGKPIPSVACAADAGQTYALYLPQKAATTALPVVYCFDPHGDGTLPVNKYRALAERYGFILVGSNNSKNGNEYSVTETIWKNLWEDTRRRLKINGNRVYLCGFSGGAKVAGYVAIQHPGIRGVIAGGAGLPDGVSAGDFPFSFTALAGEGDMNLTELVAISQELDRTKTRHRIIIFDGKHEWAPPAVMDQAFAGWQLEAMQDGALAQDARFIATYVTAARERVMRAEGAGLLISARRECVVAGSFAGGLTPDASWFSHKATALAGDPHYQQQQHAQDALLAREQNFKSEYMQHFQQGDMRYWQQTIGGLQAKAAAATPEKAMYQRLLAYLSLAFYSISNQLINAGRNDGARHFVDLYKLADAGNSEAWYFSAVLDVREGHAAAAETDLLRAADTGFRDTARMRQQPEFARGLPQGAFGRIEARMRKPISR